MSSIKIDRKIVKYRVVKPGEKAEAEARLKEPTADPKHPNVIWMHEKVERPEELIGSTYKIKTPVSDHAMPEGGRGPRAPGFAGPRRCPQRGAGERTPRALDASGVVPNH